MILFGGLKPFFLNRNVFYKVYELVLLSLRLLSVIVFFAALLLPLLLLFLTFYFIFLLNWIVKEHKLWREKLALNIKLIFCLDEPAGDAADVLLVVDRMFKHYV